MYIINGLYSLTDDETATEIARLIDHVAEVVVDAAGSGNRVITGATMWRELGTDNAGKLCCTHVAVTVGTQTYQLSCRG